MLLSTCNGVGQLGRPDAWCQPVSSAGPPSVRVIAFALRAGSRRAIALATERKPGRQVVLAATAAGLLPPALLLRQERGHEARADRGFRSGRKGALPDVAAV